MLKRSFGMTAMILSGLGLLISVILIVLIWIGHGSATSAVSSISSEVEGWMLKADQRLDDLTTSLNTINTKLEELSAEANDLAQGDPVQARVAEFVTKIDSSISPILTDAREAFVALRERASSLNDTLRLAARIIPAISLPELQGDKLEPIGERLDRLDEGLMAMRDVASSIGDAVDEVLQRVSTGLTGLADAIANVSQTVESINTEVQNAQTSVNEVESQVLWWITLGSIVLTLLALWLVLLHASLFMHGLAWFKQPKSAEGPPTGDMSPITGDLQPDL